MQPNEVSSGLTPMDRQERRLAAALTLVVDGLTAEVVTNLDRAAVPSLLLKGPAVGEWLYPPSEVRSYVDVDLLVPIGRLAEAEGILAGMGFRYMLDGINSLEEQVHARTWVRDNDPAVDLHTGLAQLPAPANDVWTVLSRDSRTLSIGDTQVAIPRPAALVLIVALRALQRGPDHREVVAELSRALEKADIGLWREVAAAAAELQAEGWLRAALGLVPGGSALADEASLGPASVRAVILATASDDTRVCALGLDRVGASQSWKEKALLLARAAVPTPDYLRATEGSTVISIVKGYGRRLRRLRSVLGGYRAWRSAVHACGANRRWSDRLEVVLWSIFARTGVAVLGLDNTLRVFGRLPVRRQGGEQLAKRDRDVLFRLAGRCLGESVARSQYLRVRGVRHDLVLGVSKEVGAFRSHAWLDPVDPPAPGFEIIHRIGR